MGGQLQIWLILAQGRAASSLFVGFSISLIFFIFFFHYFL